MLTAKNSLRHPNRSIIVCAMIVPVLCFCNAPLSRGDLILEDEMPTLLTMLTQQNKQTWNALQTWNGTLQVQDLERFHGPRARTFMQTHAPDLTTHPSDIEIRTDAIVTFARDFRHDQLYTHFQAHNVEAVALDSGQPLGLEFHPFDQCSIVTPDRFLHFQPNLNHAGAMASDRPARPTAFESARQEAEGQEWGAIVDPQTLFGYPRPAWQELEMIATALRQAGHLKDSDYALTVSRNSEDDGLEYKVTLPGTIRPGVYRFQEMTFAANAGFNITRFLIRDSENNVRQQIEWQYTEQDGILLPSQVRYQSFNAEDQLLVFQRTLTLLESQVNIVIPPQTFSVQNLGLRDGDRFLDSRAGTVSTYEGGELKAIGKPATVPGSTVASDASQIPER